MRIIFLALISSLIAASPIYAARVDEIIDAAEKGLSKTPLLEALFSQQTTVPFMDIPLNSDGKFCFDISDKKKPTIFWEYRNPDESGFLYQSGNVKFWNNSGEHEASSKQMRILDGMTKQILQWINFNPEELKKIYNVSVGKNPNSLYFVPKEKSRMFKAIELTFTPDYNRLSQLKFIGQNDEETAITFNVQHMNQPLSAECKK